MAVAFAGIVVMFADSLDGGRLAGNLLALGVSCCFAAQVTVLRKFHARVDMLPQVLVAGVVSLAVAGVVAPAFTATTRDLVVLAIMGSVQLGIGCLLATAASRHLRATELGLLALLEPILGPVWVWVLMAENPGPGDARRRRDRLRRGASRTKRSARGARAVRPARRACPRVTL